MRIMAGICTILLFATVFFAPEVVKWLSIRKLKTTVSIAVVAFLTTCAVSVTGIINSLDMESMPKVAFSLISVGTVIFATLFVLSLLFVATIPEEMEREAEDAE